MKVILSSSGSVTWDATREAVVASTSFREGVRDFGAGTENYATCAGCGRQLPTVTMHLDHILSQSRHAIKIASGDEVVSVLTADAPHGDAENYVPVLEGGILQVHRYAPRPAALPDDAEDAPRRSKRQATMTRGTHLSTQNVHAEVAWRCDLENLQFLCGACNTAKGARDFDAHFPHRLTRPLR